MIHYLIEQDGFYAIVERPYTSARDLQYSETIKEMQRIGATVHGCFGQKHYAEFWQKYYNTGGYKVNGPAKI